MITRGFTSVVRWWARVMKYRIIASVTSKSAITPSFIGRMATIVPGVRPSISLASRPTASTRRTPRASFLTATTEGSQATIPFPRA